MFKNIFFDTFLPKNLDKRIKSRIFAQHYFHPKQALFTPKISEQA